MLTYAQLPITS